MVIMPFIIKIRNGIIGAILCTAAIIVLLPRIDELKYFLFDAYCQNATEFIYKKEESNAVVIDYWPYSGVFDGEYYPLNLSRKILEAQRPYEYVQLIYDMPRDKVVNQECADRYIITARHNNELEMGNCGMINGVLHEKTKANSVKHAPFAVRYTYGKPNIFSIRSLHFYIQNTTTNEIIAEQKTFQLLLGDMTQSSNRKWYAWGAAQGANSCRITSPAEFLTKALSPKG